MNHFHKSFVFVIQIFETELTVSWRTFTGNLGILKIHEKLLNLQCSSKDGMKDLVKIELFPSSRCIGHVF